MDGVILVDGFAGGFCRWLLKDKRKNKKLQ
jgi:hypothetical protein